MSSFLEPDHFYDPLHKRDHETASKLIASGKQATPITLKTFFETAEPIDAGLTVPQYLGRLAANAATIINARDYGRTIHDLATRRGLIVIGEDVVNAAYDSPVDFPPRSRSRRPRRASSRWPRPASTARVPQPIRRSPKPSRWRTMPTSATAGSPVSPVGSRTSTPSWVAATSDLIIIAGRPGMGKSSLATNIAFHVARARALLAQRPELRADDPSHDGAVVGIFSLEMSAEQLATRILSEQCGILREDPPRHDRRRRVQAPGRGEPGDRQLVALHRPDRRDHHRPARSACGASSASMPSPHREVDYLQLLAGSARRAKRGARPGGEARSPPA